MTILSDFTAQIQRYHTQIIRVLSESISAQGVLSTIMNAPLLVVSASSALASERVLTAGTGLISADAGPNSTFTLGINNNVVATVSGTIFTGPISASSGLSGSLQNIGPNLTYLAAGSNIIIVTQSSGQVVISTTGGSSGGGDAGAQYLTLANTASLSNERLFTPGTGLLGTDAGANSTYTISVNDNIVATVSGTRFTGPVSASAGLSGSLQNIGPNLTYLAQGDGINIVTGTTGQVRISLQNTAVGDPGASYIVVGTTASLTNERVLTAGTGLLSIDAGANSNFTLNVNNNVVATVSGTTFTGPVSASAGLSGSLQNIGPSLTYLAQGSGISIVTQSSGQVRVSLSDTSRADPGAFYIIVGPATASLPNERVITAGTGIVGTDGGAGSTYTLGVNDNVVATVSGTLFTGPVSASSGLSGSLQRIGPNLTYIAAGPGINVVTASTGQVQISSTNISPGDPNATYLVVSTTASLTAERSLAAGAHITFTDGGANNTFTITGANQADKGAQFLTLANTASLDNERLFTPGTGLLGTDAGANSTYTLGINNNVVATISGTAFTGPVSSSAGFTGSLQFVNNTGTAISYIAQGPGISVVTQSTGQLRISLQNTAVGDPGASYIVVGTTASLTNERALAMGTGLLSTDGGADGNFTIRINDNVVATVSGTAFAGPVSSSGGFTGSLQFINPNLSYLAQGGGISIVTQSNGQVRVSLTDTSRADPGAFYVIVGPATASLANERVITAGAHVTLTDGGAGGNITIAGANQADKGASYIVVGNTASLDAERAITAGSHIIFTDGGANSTFTIAAANQADKGAQFLTLANTASLDNERLFTPGTGLLGTDAGANSTYTLAINNNVVATVSGTTFTGPVSASAGLTGSVQRIPNGQTFLAAGTNVTITTGTTGQVTISAVTASTVLSATFASGLTSGSIPWAMTMDTARLPLLLESIDGKVAKAISGQISDFSPHEYPMFGLFFNPEDNIAQASVETFYIGANEVPEGTPTPPEGNLVQISSVGFPGYLQWEGPIRSRGTQLLEPAVSIAREGAATVIPVFTVYSGTSSGNTAAFKINNVGQTVLFRRNANAPIEIDNAGGNRPQIGLSASTTNPTVQTFPQGWIAITISGTNAWLPYYGTAASASVQYGDPNASYIVLGATASLANERVFAPSTGLTATDAGAGGNYTLAINNNVVATVSGTTFSGIVNAGNGLSGSLQRTTSNTSFLVASSGTIITSASSGQVFISADAANDAGSAYLNRMSIDGGSLSATNSTWTGFCAGSISGSTSPTQIQHVAVGTQGKIAYRRHEWPLTTWITGTQGRNSGGGTYTNNFYGVFNDEVHSLFIMYGEMEHIDTAANNSPILSCSTATNNVISGTAEIISMAGDAVGNLKAVTNSGYIISSSNGTTWSIQDLAVTSPFKSDKILTAPREIAFNNGFWTICETSASIGHVFYSSNGTTWTQVQASTMTQCHTIAYSPELDMWAVAGSGILNSTVAISTLTPPTTWTRTVTVATGSAGNVMDTINALPGGGFVVHGNNNTHGRAYITHDGYRWRALGGNIRSLKLNPAGLSPAPVRAMQVVTNRDICQSIIMMPGASGSGAISGSQYWSVF